jgi:hypothetical protein
MTPTICCFY